MRRNGADEEARDLERRAAAGDRDAAEELFERLAEAGDVDGLFAGIRRFGTYEDKKNWVKRLRLAPWFPYDPPVELLTEPVEWTARALRISVETAKLVVAEARGGRALGIFQGILSPERLLAIDRILGNRGVEALRLQPGSDAIIAEYSNNGDSYRPTVIWWSEAETARAIATEDWFVWGWADFAEWWGMARGIRSCEECSVRFEGGGDLCELCLERRDDEPSVRVVFSYQAYSVLVQYTSGSGDWVGTNLLAVTSRRDPLDKGNVTVLASPREVRAIRETCQQLLDGTYDDAFESRSERQAHQGVARRMLRQLERIEEERGA